MDLVIQIFNDSYDAGVDVIFPYSCPYGFVPYGFVPYPEKGLLEVYEDMVEILLMLQEFLAEDPEIEYSSVVILPALKPACSSTMISSACGWSLFRMVFDMTLLGWLIRLMIL